MILLTGGSGLLGRELRKHIACYAPTHEELDVLKPWGSIPPDTTMIVHAAAYTDVAKAELERGECYAVNVLGTMEMAKLGLPLVYISSEYVFDGERGDYLEADATRPLNFYATTKAHGEKMAQYAPRWLIIRTLFKPRPYKHDQAPTDMLTTGDYVDVIAPMIVRAIKLFQHGKLEGIIHIGTEKKSVFDLAHQSRDVKPITRSDIRTILPRDTSLCLAKWRSLQA